MDRSILGPGAFVQTNVIGVQPAGSVPRRWTAGGHLFRHVSTDGCMAPWAARSVLGTGRYDQQSYSASKAASDHLVRYHRTYGLR